MFFWPSLVQESWQPSRRSNRSLRRRHPPLFLGWHNLGCKCVFKKNVCLNSMNVVWPFYLQEGAALMFVEVARKAGWFPNGSPEQHDI